MKKIGVLSDTHGTLVPEVFEFFKDCDELWHAGDMGLGVLEKLRQFKPVRAVWGNCDAFALHYELPEMDFFVSEGCRVMMLHIGGWPGHYSPAVKRQIALAQPDILVCGHTHILLIEKVEYTLDDSGTQMLPVTNPDQPRHQFLHINPGAAGRQGFHQKATLVRFVLDGKPRDVEMIEFPKNPH